MTHPNAPDSQPPQQSAIALTDKRQALERIERTRYLAQQYGWTEPQIDVIRNAICVNATDAELEFFIATAKRLELDPFARQIWFVKRRQRIEDSFGNDSWVDVGRPETGIDGYRTIAERSGEFEGQDPTLWIDEVGKPHGVWLHDKPPAACMITIHRKGRKPTVAVGLFREYCPVYKTKTGEKIPQMWLKRPGAQLEKCVEALAFRRAFPRDLSGIRIDTEMEHVDAGASSSYVAPAVQDQGRGGGGGGGTVTLGPRPVLDVVTPEPPPAEPVSASSARQDDFTKPDDDEAELDIMRVVSAMLDVISAATDRKAMGDSIGPKITAAKADIKTANASELSQAILRDVVPAFQAKWRELEPTTTKGKR